MGNHVINSRWWCVPFATKRTDRKKSSLSIFVAFTNMANPLFATYVERQTSNLSIRIMSTRNSVENWKKYKGKKKTRDDELCSVLLDRRIKTWSVNSWNKPIWKSPPIVYPYYRSVCMGMYTALSLKLPNIPNPYVTTACIYHCR